MTLRVVIGIITLEDIVEEITGEFYETNKKEEEEIKQLAPDKWLVNPNIEVSELNRLYNFKLPEGIYSTVGGLVQYYLGKIPKKGDKVEFPNLTIKVISADEKKIKKLLIIRKNTNSSK
jgi:magnesium and cobalt transporter